MALAPGTRLGPYEVTALIGEGGMGKVWRAHHTGLKRDDALKVLPDAFASDSDRLARFRREAQVLASLNHPNIAHVYGLEQSDGVQALVMELVEGPTLADRIARTIPVDEALAIAKQIAEALEAAHERGIIHRDLKPANIKVRPDGTVKVLDFGLAKALDPISAAGVDATTLPTITSPAMMTGVGVLLGTAAYMSPEQARGKAVDKRTDVWAFGCVLYEMVTGQRPFGGEDVADTLGAVIHKEPDWTRLPPELAPTTATYLRRCLQKDARQRVQAAGDIRLALDGAYDAPAVGIDGSESDHGRTRWVRRVRLASVALVLLLGGLTAGSVLSRVGNRAPDPPTRFTVTFPDGAVAIPGAPRIALSADGRTLVYGGRGQLYRRSLDSFAEVAIAGSEGGTNPVPSPDGRWVAFARNPGDLFKVPLEGGPSSPIVRGGAVRGFCWEDDDSILIGTALSGLSRVSSNGGNPEPVTTVRDGEIAHRWPDLLPGGTAAVFTVWGGSNRTNQIAVASLLTGEHRVLFEGVYARYSPTGHLIFVQNASLWAVPFDANSLETVGSAAPLLTGVVPTTPDGAAQVALGRNGTLAYEPEFGNDARTLAWVDRQGRETLLAMPPGRYALPRLSPDGDRVALQVDSSDIWIWDTVREVLTRLTVDPSRETYPLWTPDGSRVVFTSDRAGPANLYIQAADGSGEAERLTNGSNTEYGHAFTPDGRRLVFRDSVGGGGDIAVLSMEAGHARQPVLASEFQERNAELSPDGRWMAYESNASGQIEIYLRPFPRVNDRLLQVSTSGGLQPRWTAGGKELYYLDLANHLMVVSVDSSNTPGTVVVSPPKAVLDFEQAGYIIRGPGRDYDVSADGSRVLVLKASANRNDGGRVFVVQGWGEELKRLVPTN